MYNNLESRRGIIKRLPNMLSAARIALAAVLPFAAGNNLLFITLYVLCGVSDVLDGFIARRYGAASPTGALLDSIGDAVFWVAIFYLVLTRTDLMRQKAFLYTFLSVCVMRAVNLAITRAKFRRWGILHSIGSKAAGLLLFLILPIFIWRGGIIWPLAWLLFLTALLSALDETLLLSSNTYDPDAQGFFINRNK